MSERIHMNTKSLQKQYASEYEDFFAKHDLVISVSNSFPWNIWFRENKKQIHIKQKVPTKTYIGINITTQPEVKLWMVNMLDIHNAVFEHITFQDINKKAIEIEKLLWEEAKLSGYNKGMQIDFLSENPRGHGFGFSGAAGVLMATAMFLLTGKIKVEQLSQYDTFVDSKLFEEVFTFAWKIEDISKYGHSIGNNCYVSMVNSSLPAIVFCEDYNNDENKNIVTYKYKIKDFLKIENDIEDLHLDYGVMFSWVKNKIENNYHIFDTLKDEFDELQKNTLTLLKDNDIKSVKKFPFENTFNNSFFSVLEDSFFVLNFKLLNAFQNLLKGWFDTKTNNEFIQTLKENNMYWLLFEKENKLFASMIFRFNYYKKFDDEMLEIFPISTSKIWWSFVFVMKHNKSRETLHKTLEKLQEIWYKDLILEYASWIDGTCADGIQIGQWINNGIFSAYIQKDQVYYRDNTWESFVGNYNEIMGKNKEWLLLDMIHNKMYLNGKKLTSSDLCSQTTTINVLYKLMENMEQDVANKEFEVSSYSKNKNEMIGKIVLPLISLIEKETGERFPLICKWSIYDFYMKLKQSIIKIAIIRKI